MANSCVLGHYVSSASSCSISLAHCFDRGRPSGAPCNHYRQSWRKELESQARSVGTVPTLKGTSLHSFGGKNDDLFVSFLYIYFYCNHDSFRDLFFFFFFICRLILRMPRPERTQLNKCLPVRREDTAQCPSVGTEDTAQCPSVGREDTAQCPSVGRKDTAQCPSVGREDTAQCLSVGREDTAQCPSVGRDDTAECPSVGREDTAL